MAWVRISISSKIILTLLLSGLCSLAVGGVIGYVSGLSALTQSLDQRLTAQREIKRLWIESYIRDQIRFTEAVAAEPTTIEGTKELVAVWREMRAGVLADTDAMARDNAVLEEWYTSKFIPRIDRVAGGHLPLEGIMPSNPVARKLQADYITRNPFPLGEGGKMMAAPGGSRFDVIHARFHPAMKREAETVGFYDINLMDAETGDVVYTEAKEADFGSNMYHGPFQRSGFAMAAQRVLDPANGGRTVIQDYNGYMPSAFLPQMFTAVPIVDNGKIIAVFVAQIDVERLNNMLTDNGNWTQTGQGETGEVLLIGEDRLFRSKSRFWATQPERFLEQLTASGVPASVTDKIKALGTTILALPTRAPQVELAFRNQTGVGIFTDVRGIKVVSAYGLVEVAGLRWMIQAKQDASEAFASAAALDRQLFIAAAIAAMALTFVALMLSAVFTRPLRRVIAGMRSIEANRAPAVISLTGNDEFAELARGYNTMASTLNRRDAAIANVQGKVDDLLRDLYPAALADRIKGGLDVQTETVANTTVVVTWIDGLDAVTAGKSAAELDVILEALLGAINGAAELHGIEPFGAFGEMQIAVCGLSSPRLDHATNVLAWTQTAIRAVQQLNTEWARSISLRFGFESGEIDVLLLKSSHVAYEIWGRPVKVARRVVLEAAAGCVVAGERAYGLLSNVKGFRANPPVEVPSLGPVRTWMRAAIYTPTNDASRDQYSMTAAAEKDAS